MQEHELAVRSDSEVDDYPHHDPRGDPEQTPAGVPVLCTTAMAPRHLSSASIGSIRPRTSRRPTATRDILESLALLSRVLAGADAAAIVVIRAQRLIVEAGDPRHLAPRPGTLLGLPPSMATLERDGIVGLLLSGDLGWSCILPPDGFAHAALIALPARYPPARLLMVANRDRGRPLTERGLDLAAAFSAQTSQLLAVTRRPRRDAPLPPAALAPPPPWLDPRQEAAR